MENPIAGRTNHGTAAMAPTRGWLGDVLILLLVGVAAFPGTIFAPPSLMDDVDAVNAQIARGMLASGDWVTAHINGVAYLEKSPLGYWLIAICFKVFGVHDWTARIPDALGAVALILLTAAMASWGFGRKAGFYAGLALGSCAGLFLFTRIIIPDVLLTLAVTASIFSFLRTIVDKNRNWAWGFWGALGVGMLLKGLLAALVPVATATLFLLIRRQLFRRETYRLLHPWTGLCLTAAIYAPWVLLAAWRNPPFFDLTFHSAPGVYRGFFWFYFMNEHVLRFLNLRYPHDYDTVPRLLFWSLHLVWLFPWSVFLPAILKSSAPDEASRATHLRLAASIWILFLLIFLSFSTTQEYYSLPCYPAFAVLLGAAVANGPRRWLSAGYGLLAGLGVLMALASGVILFLIRNVPAPGDISSALTNNPGAYTLSMGHMQDLTLNSFAYLRGPLLMAALVMSIGGLAAWFLRKRLAGPVCLAIMMVLFIHAAHWAQGVFDPYLSSRPLADAINAGPKGQLVIEGHYYPFSSVGFYTGQPALLLNGIRDNLIYGAAAPNAPHVFISDHDLALLWKGDKRIYLVASAESRPRLNTLLGDMHIFASSGGKLIFCNF